MFFLIFDLIPNDYRINSLNINKLLTKTFDKAIKLKSPDGKGMYVVSG